MFKCFTIVLFFLYCVLGSSYVSSANDSVYISPTRIRKVKVRPIPSSEWNDNVKLWLARSCAGEAGFNAADECIAIAWVYATRWKSSQGSFLSMVKGYSAAIKDRSTHTRRWILNLSLNGKRPVGWPERLKWSNHRVFWSNILSELDQWAIGNRSNPVVGADHFGGKMDKPGSLWVRVYPTGKEFKNRFYRSPSAPPIKTD